MLMEKSKRIKRVAVAVAASFCAVVLAISLLLNYWSGKEQRDIVEDSIKGQLMSTCYAARELIDPVAFAAYNTQADVDADWDHYTATRQALRDLADTTGAEYIYALKLIDGVSEFIIDTDTVDESIFVPYEDMGTVHEEAFAGHERADVNNLQDAYGTFHSGAVPILLKGQVIGIIGVDIEDDHLQQSEQRSARNLVILAAVLVVTLGLMMAALLYLLRRMRKLEEQISQMALYDGITGLPNRHYLFEYLDGIVARSKQVCFALLFIDLDNFKQVNDNAGHDAGDELLRRVGEYLQSRHDNSRAFRPAAGLLNVSARVGGDEFIQIVPGVKTEEEAGQVAQKLLEDFNALDTTRYIKEYKVGMSIGVALYPYHTDSYHVLIKYADIAMYHAKHGGKNAWAVYQDNMAPKEEK